MFYWYEHWYLPLEYIYKWIRHVFCSILSVFCKSFLYFFPSQCGINYIYFVSVVNFTSTKANQARCNNRRLLKTNEKEIGEICTLQRIIKGHNLDIRVISPSESLYFNKPVRRGLLLRFFFFSRRVLRFLYRRR